MIIYKKALSAFLCTLILGVSYITLTSLISPVTAKQQSLSLMIEKRFENAMLVLPVDLFKVEQSFKNSAFLRSGKKEKPVSSFQNTNLLIAERIVLNSPDYIDVNYNLNNQNYKSEITGIAKPEPTATENGLSSLIVIDEKKQDIFSNVPSNRLYIDKLQGDSYISGYLKDADYTGYSGLHLERGESEPEDSSYYYGDETMPAFANLLNGSFANSPMAESESEISLDMADIDSGAASRLPTSDIFNRFSGMKDLNIVVANELEPVEIDCDFLPEKSERKEFNKFYVVTSKDSLLSIAREYGITLSELMSANKLQAASVAAGTTLLVPDKAVSGEDEKSLALSDDKKKPDQNVQASARLEAPKKMQWPASSRRITSRYGVRVHPVYRVKKFHNGIDIGASYGSAIKAAADGTVVYSGWKSNYGRTIIVKHSSDIYTLYAHCSKLVVKKGVFVKRNELIAKIGSSGLSTGPHLHFSVQKSGRFINPVKYF